MTSLGILLGSPLAVFWAGRIIQRQDTVIQNPDITRVAFMDHTDKSNVDQVEEWVSREGNDQCPEKEQVDLRSLPSLHLGPPTNLL